MTYAEAIEILKEPLGTSTIDITTEAIDVALDALGRARDIEEQIEKYGAITIINRKHEYDWSE